MTDEANQAVQLTHMGTIGGTDCGEGCDVIRTTNPAKVTCPNCRIVMPVDPISQPERHSVQANSDGYWERGCGAEVLTTTAALIAEDRRRLLREATEAVGVAVTAALEALSATLARQDDSGVPKGGAERIPALGDVVVLDRGAARWRVEGVERDGAGDMWVWIVPRDIPGSPVRVQRHRLTDSGVPEFRVGDLVRLKAWEERGEVVRVEESGLWVETDCNTYRNWSRDCFVREP